MVYCATVANAQNYSTLHLANSNTTGAAQNPLNLGNWNTNNAPQYSFYTNDLGGSSPLRIHSTRWGGGLTLTRDGSSGDVTLLHVGGWDGVGASMLMYNASNQVSVLLNGSGDSYLSAGGLGIGTTDLKGYKLAVNGSAIFEMVKVKLYGQWPDYVFGKNYKLMPLADLERFIQQNNHLPEIPPAATVESSGVDVGANQAALLKKIEELTLYIIEQNKRIEALEKQSKGK